MRRVFPLTLMLMVFAAVQTYADDFNEFTSEELQLIDQAKQGGATEEQIKEMVRMLKAKHGEEKKWSEEELDGLDRMLTAKWEEMRGALEQGDVDTAASYFCDKTRARYRQIFSGQSTEQLSQLSLDLSDIQFIRAQGTHRVEYDIQLVKEGKRYSYMLIFEKNSDDVWEIYSF